MDVILLKDVARLGAEGTVMTVKAGYARNYLIPNGLAAPATSPQRGVLEARKRRRDRQAARLREQAITLKQQLEGRSLTLTLSMGEGNKPFGSITPHDLIQALEREQVTVDRHAIQLDEPIKALGVYEVPVRLHPEVTATLKVSVVKA